MRRPFQLMVSLAIGLAGATALSAAQKEPVLIRNGTILTITQGVIEHGSVLIRDGKIAAVGRDFTAPAEARVIDATGKYVLPGILDVHSHMGIYSWPGVEANADGNELTDPITPQVRALDAINIADPAFTRALAGGVTTVQVLPGSGNLIGGQSAVLKLKPGRTLDEMLFPGAPPGLKMACGENPKRVYGGRTQMPSTRMGNIFKVREAFTKAREYIAKWEAYQAKVRRGEKELSPPDRDLKLEVLADVLRGKIRVHWHCYRQDDILNMLKIADEFGFKIASFQHALEAYKLADELARRQIAISTWADWWGFKLEAWDGIPYSAAILASYGVRVNIHSDSSDGVQRLFHEAAKALKYGLPEDEALRAITLNPAWALGIDDRVGSIEVGKDADLAIFSGHPFGMYSLVEKTLVDGEVLFDRTAETATR